MEIGANADGKNRYLEGRDKRWPGGSGTEDSRSEVSRP